MTEWTDWSGGECPIPDVKSGSIEIKTREGRTYELDAIESILPNWHHACSGSILSLHDIIAYRLIEKEQSDLDWLEELVQAEFDHQKSKPPNYASIAAREAYRKVLDFIKERKEAKS
jgi:hypothetical protein